jgi:hypothetical protein
VIAFKSVSVPEVLDDGQRALLCPVNLEPTAPSAASANSIALGYARISKSDFTSSRMAEDMSSLQCAIFADRANSGLSSRSIDRFPGEMRRPQKITLGEMRARHSRAADLLLGLQVQPQRRNQRRSTAG